MVQAITDTGNYIVVQGMKLNVLPRGVQSMSKKKRQKLKRTTSANLWGRECKSKYYIISHDGRQI